MARKKSFFKNSILFSPSRVRKTVRESAVITNQYKAILSESNISSTASFRYDTHEGFKSTQQIPVDWSKLENHTFFNSAESKVNVAFAKIINEYPFDGNKKELEQFFDNLTGYENYIYGIFPKYRNFLHFSGAIEKPTGVASTEGQYIEVPDFAGSLKPTLSKLDTGQTVIDPGLKPISFVMHLFVPKETNKNQVIAQKIFANDELGDFGFTLGIEETLDTSVCNFRAIFSSGSTKVISASMEITKGGFNHVCAMLDRRPGNHSVKLFKSGTLITSSSKSYEFGDFGFSKNMFVIGSGTFHITKSIDSSGFLPQQTFSGALDEFRIFHSARSSKLQKEFRLKNIFPSDDLKLYYKFNEPTGSLGLGSTPAGYPCLDSSGMSLHANITNFTSSSRVYGDLTVPLTLERDDRNPVLFPLFPTTIKLNGQLLESAEQYDANNPNLITNLIPRHYLLESMFEEGFASVGELGNINNNIASSSIDFPSGGKLPASQIITLLMFLWGKEFDEIKMFLDHFSRMVQVDYERDDFIADQFLPFLGDYYGFSLPIFYSNADINQVIDGEDLLPNPSLGKNGLRYIQNQLWRRILTNFNEIIRSKGTIHGIKALIRAAGLDPDTNFRFREFGGAHTKDLKVTRKERVEVASILNMSGGLRPGVVADENAQGVSSKRPFFQSPFLSGSRFAIGYPDPTGTFVKTSKLVSGGYPHGISNNRQDGFFTSGSWTYECIYKFTEPSSSRKHGVLNSSHAATQSLARLQFTGSSQPGHVLGFNLLAFSGSLVPFVTSSLKVWGRPSGDNADPSFSLVLTGVNIFDGKHWNISFGRRRNDEINSLVSSSYFLKAARQTYGEIDAYHATSSYILECKHGPSNNILQAYSASYAASGAFVCIGSQSISRDVNAFLNNPENIGSWSAKNIERLWTRFSGKFCQMRFWSRALEDTEFKEHTRNFKSVGVLNPFKHFNFVVTPTGSFEKLRLDVSVDQPVTKSNENGELLLTDFSQNLADAKITGCGNDMPLIETERFAYGLIDPKFDERSEDNKVRIRSFQDYDNVLELGGEIAPIYEVRKSERPVDDTRFIIENSFVQALNEDIITIFANLDEFNNILGNPELLFSDTYPDLRVLRDVYFNRLTSKINIKEFFEFYKWIDSSLGMIIERLVPIKTKFLGINFVIESHMLERAKFKYDWMDQYYLGAYGTWREDHVSIIEEDRNANCDRDHKNDPDDIKLPANWDKLTEAERRKYLQEYQKPPDLLCVRIED